MLDSYEEPDMHKTTEIDASAKEFHSTLTAVRSHLA
jgi:Fms-interacting protein/Thoc5